MPDNQLPCLFIYSIGGAMTSYHVSTDEADYQERKAWVEHQRKRNMDVKIIPLSLALKAQEMHDALKLMLEDYRTEGCPDPDCLVCQSSKLAKERALNASA